MHLIGLFAAALPVHHQVQLRNVPLTSVARTVADCARGCERTDAVVLADAALRRGLGREAILEVLADCAGWPGARRARDVVLFASPWSETALESLARCWFDVQGIPQPAQQRVIRVDGRFVARVDFVWEKYRTVGEVDGRLKYTDLNADGAALWKEKRREDDLRDAGLEVVRGYWSDGDDLGAAFAERLRRAFARGLRAVGPPAYLIEPQRVTPKGAARRAS